MLLPFGNTVLINSSIEFEINGLFMDTDDLISRLDHKGSIDPISCNASSKVVEITLHGEVFSSVGAYILSIYIDS